MSTRSSSPTFQHVVDGIYDAAMDPALWKDVIADVASYGQSSFALLTWRDQSRTQGPPALRVETAHSEMADEYYERYLTGVGPVDPIVSIMNGPVDAVYVNNDFEPREALVKTERYQKYFKPTDLEDRGTVLVLRQTEAQSAVLTLGRGRREDPIDRRALVPLQELSPHVRCALGITRRFQRLSAQQSAMYAALEQVHDGLFFVDGVGRVVFSNSAAESLVKRGVLSVRRRRLRTSAPAETADLQMLMQRAIATGAGRAADPGGTLTLHAPDGTERAVLSVSPLRVPFTGERHSAARAVVVVKERVRAEDVMPEVLQASFGLTPAEARLAIDLLRGSRLDQIAEQRNVGKETLRTQLQHIFDKIGVNRQAELIKVLLSLPVGGLQHSSDGGN